MAIVKCRLEAWKPKIRIVRNTGELAGLLEPAVWVSCDTYEAPAVNIRRGNALESFNYTDRVFEPTQATFRLTNRPHNYAAVDASIYEYIYKDSDGDGIPVPSDMYDSGGAYYGLTADTGNVRLRQRWGVFTHFFYEFQYIRLIDLATHLVIFQGRITKISKQYEDGNGSVVTLAASDALDTIANITNSNLVKDATFSTSQRRSDLIKYLINLAVDYESTKPSTGPESSDTSPTVSDITSTDGTGALVTADASTSDAENYYKRFERSMTVFPRETVWKAESTGSKHVLAEIARWATLDPHASSTSEQVFGYDYFVDPNYGKYNLDATKGPGVAGWNSPQFNYFKRGNRLSSAGSASQDPGVYGLTVKYPTITTATRQGARNYNLGQTAGGANASATTFPLVAGHLVKPGYVIQIGSEIMYVNAVYPDDEGVSTNDEINVIRGFNATTAASFSANATVAYPRPAQTIMHRAFNFDDTKEDLATEAVMTYSTAKDSKKSDGSAGEEKERLKQKRLEIMYVTEVALGGGNPFQWDGRNMDTDFEDAAFSYAAETLDAYNASGAKQADDVCRIQYQSHSTLTGATNFAYILVSDITTDFPSTNYASDAYVELRGSVSGAKCRLNLAVGLSAAHEGRPSKVWGVHRVIDLGKMNDDDPTDLRKEAAARLAQATTGLRQGQYSFSKAPYYWWEGQVKTASNHSDGQTIEVKNLNGSAAIKVTNFGVRAGMLVHKMTDSTFNIMAQSSSKDVYGYISAMTDDDTFVVDLTESQSFAVDDYIKIIIPLKAGSSVFVDNVIADVYGEHIVTDVTFEESPAPVTTLKSIGKNESRIAGGQKIRGFAAAIAQTSVDTKERVNRVVKRPQGTQFAFFSATVPNGSEAATRVKATWSAGQLKLLDGRVYQFAAGSTAVSTYGLNGNMTPGTSYIVYLDPEGENLGPQGTYHLYTKATSIYVQDADNIPVFHVQVSSNATATTPSLRLQPNIVFDQTAAFKVDATDSLEAASITSTVLDALAVTEAKIDNLAVTSGKLTNNTITGKTFVDTGLEIDNSGYLRSSGKTDYADSTAGFWLGKNSGAYKLDIGDSSNYVRWTGSALEVKGSITLAGSSSALTESTILNANVTANDVGLGSVSNITTAQMRANAGACVDGTIAGWVIEETVIRSADSTTQFFSAGVISVTDGAFILKSSSSGARVEITEDGLIGYDSSGNAKTTVADGNGLLTSIAGTFKTNADITRTSATTISNHSGVILDGDGIIGGASGVTQFYIKASDGKAYFGAGTVIADTDGIRINTTNTGWDNKRLTFSASNSLAGFVSASSTEFKVGTAYNRDLILGTEGGGGGQAGNEPSTNTMVFNAKDVRFASGTPGSGIRLIFPTSGADDDDVLTVDSTSNGVTSLVWAAPSGGGGDVEYAFKTISTPSGTNPVANIAEDTLNLATANDVIAISGNGSTETVTFTGNAYRTVEVPGTTLTAAGDDTLNFSNGSGISITGNASTDTITVAYTGASSETTSSEDGTTGTHEHTLASGHDGSHTGGTNNYVAAFTATNILQSATSARTATKMYINNLFFNGVSPYCGTNNSRAHQVYTGIIDADAAVTMSGTVTMSNAAVKATNLGEDSNSNGTNILIESDGTLVKESSSQRYKENIVDMTLDSSKIYDLTARTFKWKDTTRTNYTTTEDEDEKAVTTEEVINIPGATDFGLIAEEVHAILPALVTLDSDSQPEGVKYAKIPILLLEEIKKLKARIEVLENNG